MRSLIEVAPLVRTASGSSRDAMIVPDVARAERGNLPAGSPESRAEAGTAPHGALRTGHVDSRPSRANNRDKRTGMILRKGQSVVLICVLAALANAQSQNAPSSLLAAQSAVVEHDPEDAYLSTTRYTNAYFGFEFDLPPEARLKPIPMPAGSDRRIQLLEMLGP